MSMFYLFLAFLAGCWLTRAYMLASFEHRLRLLDEAWRCRLNYELSEAWKARCYD